jgi:hypothetical protein
MNLTRSFSLLITVMVLTQANSLHAQDSFTVPPPDTVTFHSGALQLKGWLSVQH